VTQLVVGLGTGRCGTHSLAYLLNSQHRADVRHERAPYLRWHNETDPLRHFSAIPPTALFGDVGFYYLKYVQQIWDTHPQVKFACLVRQREQTIASFVRHMHATAAHANWFQASGRRNYWDDAFPSFPGELSLADAVGRYWDEYYAEALRLAVYGQFEVFDMNNLNSTHGVKRILAFCEVAKPWKVVFPQLDSRVAPDVIAEAK